MPTSRLATCAASSQTCALPICYKNRRKQKLRGIALSAASRAKRQHARVSLPPMNAYERRLIHLALVEDAEVTTHSEGEDPARHVVITPLRG